MSNAVITGFFALGGAFLGFLGSWFAATRAAQATREQVQASRKQTQQDRIHERRDEAVSESYAQILAIDDAYRKMVLRYRSSDIESKRKEANDLVITMIGDWDNHFRKNLPWIPEEVGDKLSRTVGAYQERVLDFEKSLEEATEAQLIEVLKDEDIKRKAMREESNVEWLRFDVRAALGIEEPDEVSKDALRGRSRNPE